MATQVKAIKIQTVSGSSAQFPYSEQLLGHKQLLTPMQNSIIQVMLRALTYSQRRELRKNACALRPENVPLIGLSDIVAAVPAEIAAVGNRSRRDRIRDSLVGLHKRKLLIYADAQARFYLPADHPKQAKASQGPKYRRYRVNPKHLTGDLSRLDLSDQPYTIERAGYF